ncbi:transcription factor bHLH149 [Dendrobium catenatum]|uniref:transcription factor bHLH149 n=1 Tax=Dendrobium catenatum TaxID=906689 RepID=UPI0009F17BEA|nr:transcription factor bHLH149 [Dendrobium catenatum]
MSKWQSKKQQWIYGRRLLEALRSARSGRTGPLVIKKAADSALALSVRGQSRWSRAILFGPCRGGKPKLKLKACSKIPRHRPFLSAGKLVAAQTKGRKVRDRLRVLSRLVPGCKKLPAASVLSETADYVAALQMQVNTMRVLAEVLSTSAVVATRGDGELGVEELR